MNQESCPYRYFKGEIVNPFDPDRQNSAFMFWEFERKYDESHMGPQADQADSFKKWLYNLLMEYLPGKYETEDEYFLKLYWKS